MKLVKERLYRHLSLEQSAQLLMQMSLTTRINDTLFKLLEINYIKHRKQICINDSLKRTILAAYKFTGKGSQLLYDSLEDPSIQIPSIDANKKNPKMTKPLNQQQADQMNLIDH